MHGKKSCSARRDLFEHGSTDTRYVKHIVFGVRKVDEYPDLIQSAAGARQRKSVLCELIDLGVYFLHTVFSAAQNGKHGDCKCAFIVIRSFFASHEIPGFTAEIGFQEFKVFVVIHGTPQKMS